MFEFSSIFFIYYPTKNSRYMIWWTKIQLVTMTTLFLLLSKRTTSKSTQYNRIMSIHQRNIQLENLLPHTKKHIQ